ncbi:hypothetical protein [uncultured Corynebacterium sp.]|uniref:hypothetical protein n=1 Tax=uncultured Corynebacterium sp. TaxID=159447 RepID=UPI0026127423|nr:hypothetical protein [uncultured Corynebacterium sp.]
MSEALCTWPVDDYCLPDNADPIIIRECVDTAVGILWALTGRRFTICPTTVRPCPPQTAGICPTPGATYLHCSRSGSIQLPGPVYKVTGFTVAGQNIDLSSLIVDGDRIYRHAGEPWPDQNLNVADTEPGGWSITYLKGIPVPPGGSRCAALLAKEFYAACTGGRCQLPRRVQQVQRQGVTVTAVDPQDIYASGATGLTEVDIWIRAHNPNRMSEPATIWSPDLPIW